MRQAWRTIKDTDAHSDGRPMHQSRARPHRQGSALRKCLATALPREVTCGLKTAAVPIFRAAVPQLQLTQDPRAACRPPIDGVLRTRVKAACAPRAQHRIATEKRHIARVLRPSTDGRPRLRRGAKGKYKGSKKRSFVGSRRSANGRATSREFEAALTS